MESPAASMMPPITSRKTSASSRNTKRLAMKAPNIRDEPAIRGSGTSRANAQATMPAIRLADIIAPRLMQTGNMASPCRHDVGACRALREPKRAGIRAA